MVDNNQKLVLQHLNDYRNENEGVDYVGFVCARLTGRVFTMVESVMTVVARMGLDDVDITKIARS